MSNGYVILDFAYKQKLKDRFIELSKIGKPILAVNVDSKYYDTDTYQFVKYFENTSFFLPAPNVVGDTSMIFNLSFAIKGTQANPVLAQKDKLNISNETYSIIRG